MVTHEAERVLVSAAQTIDEHFRRADLRDADKIDRSVETASASIRSSPSEPNNRSPLDLPVSLANYQIEGELRNGVATPPILGAGVLAERVVLLRQRAEHSLKADRVAEAVADLEAAYTLDVKVAPELAEYLNRRRTTPAGGGDRALWLRLFDLWFTMRSYDNARELLGEWLAREPGDIEFLRKAAFMDGLAGRWDEAVELCDRILGLEQGQARIAAALLVAAACAQADYPNDARPVLEAVARDNPADPVLREHLRRIYEQTGAHRELAELALTEAENVQDPDDRFGALRRAASLFMGDVGDPDAAVVPLHTAHELRPRDGDVAVLLADALIGSNRLQEAANFLDTWLTAQKGRRSHEVSMMQQRMAAIAGAVGDRANEAGWLNAALDSYAQNSEAASRLADVATEIGQLDVAIKALKAITMMTSPKPITRPMAYLRQALIAQQRGDIRKAVLLAHKARSVDPNFEDANTLLAKLNG